MISLNNKFFRIAYKTAKKHIESYDDGKMIAYHACIIFKGGKVLAVSTNNIKRNSFVAKYYKESYIGTHAECNSILKISRKIDLTGAKAFVVRVRPNGSLGLSRPCKNCENVLREYGIKKVYYSLDSGEYETMRI